ncbi:MAG: efflux RND transporter permease subunit [Planctomycetes bacterium]|nr:efflux RND transporter permease subunit [Planctomycetota bacterium]
MCACLLRKSEPSQFFLFRWFESGFTKMTAGYMKWVTFLSRRLIVSGLIYIAILCGAGYGFMTTPTSFVPLEDKGNFMIDVALPSGSSLERTENTLDLLYDTISSEPGVAHVMSVSGYSILKGTIQPDSALIIVVLDSWEERPTKDLHQMAILRRVQQRCNSIITAQVRCFPQPPIPGVGLVAGQEMVLQDRMARSPLELAAAMNAFVVQANSEPELANTYGLLQADQPQIFLDIDREKAKALNVSLDELFGTLSSYLGSAYVNDFNKFGKVYQVKIQAADEHRAEESDIGRLFVRNRDGKMVPLSTMVSTSNMLAPASLDRYNLFNAANINSTPAPGYSSSQAIVAMERVAASVLPEGYSIEWTGMTFQEIDAGSMAPILFSLAVLFVFLFLVAQYESWTIPISVLMSIPIALGGAIMTLMLFPALGLNFYGQVGLVLLIGLSTKSAILVVEFAKDLREKEGKSIFEATVTAARLRFRAVLMTALSFVLGVIPLLTASGCGATSRISLGLVVFGGMVMARVVGTLLVPSFYALVQSMREWVKGPIENWGIGFPVSAVADSTNSDGNGESSADATVEDSASTDQSSDESAD